MCLRRGFKEALAHPRGHRFQRGLWINAGLGLFQHRCVEVGREDVEVPIPADFGARGKGRHGDGVRLLSGRAASRPHPDAGHSRGCGFDKRRQHFVPEVLEMVALAEELRQVRGNGINQIADLVDALAAVQERAIVAERVQPQGSQALHQAGIGHVALVGREHDAAALVNDADDGLEVRLRKREFEAVALL